MPLACVVNGKFFALHGGLFINYLNFYLLFSINKFK
jgi:hypothetical protein